MLKRFFSWFSLDKRQPLSVEQRNEVKMDAAAAPVLEMVRKALRDGNRKKVVAIYTYLTPGATAEICKRMTTDELIQVATALSSRRDQANR